MKKGVWVLKFVVFAVLAVGLFTWITMMLWNWLVPVLFAGPVITFWQALGLLVLSKILFWSFGRGGHHQGGHWRGHYLKRKWQGMTPDERERFRQAMKDKWCYKKPENSSGSNPAASNV